MISSFFLSLSCSLSSLFVLIGPLPSSDADRIQTRSLESMSELIGNELIVSENMDGFVTDEAAASRHSRKRKLTSEIWNHFDKSLIPGGQLAKCHYCFREFILKGNCGTTLLWRHVKGKCPNYELPDVAPEVKELPKAQMIVGEAGGSSLKGKKLTSSVWHHFDRFAALDGKGTLAKCHYCGKTMPGDRKGDKSQGTNQLWRHLKKKCPNFQGDNDEGTDSKRQIVRFSGNGNGVFTGGVKLNQDKSRRDLAEAVILHGYPFSLVEHFAFQKFIKNLQPQFNIVPQDTIISDCMTVNESEETKVRGLLDKIQSRVSLTCDLWSSHHGVGYLSIAAHFIDNEWKLHKRMIGFSKLESCDSMAECIFKAVLNKLSDWNLDKKLFCIVSENCDANDIAAKQIQQCLVPGALPIRGELFNLQCCAHVLTLIVQDCFDTVKHVFEKIRESIKYVRAIGANQETFMMYGHQLFGPNNTWVIDVPNRWDSTYKMIDAALKSKDSFYYLASIDENFSCMPTDVEWENVKNVSESLFQIFELAEFLSNINCPTSNVYFTMICELKVQLKAWCNGENILKSAISCKILEFFETYWSNAYRMLAIASILDPRLKMKPIEFYFPIIYGEDSSEEKIMDVRSCLAKLFGEYQYVMRSASEERTPVNGNQTSSTNNAHGEVSSLTTAWSDRMKRLSKYLEESSSNQPIKTELDLYLEEPTIPFKDGSTDDFNVLVWWKTFGAKYPVLGQIAKDALAVPLSAMSPEVVFQTGELVLDQYRSCMSTKIVQGMVCTQDWLRSEYEAEALVNPNAFGTLQSISVKQVFDDEQDWQAMPPALTQ